MIYIGADHAGFEVKSQLKKEIEENRLNYEDIGTNSPESVDYPDIANLLATKLKHDPKAQGILICGSGIGISIAANRHRHLRAALCDNATEARLARTHNDANVLVFGARTMGIENMKDSMHAFLNTKFEGGRHTRRVEKLSKETE